MTLIYPKHDTYLPMELELQNLSTQIDLLRTRSDRVLSVVPDIPGSTAVSSAIHTDAAGEISGITEKNPPSAADLGVIEDSESGDEKRSVQCGNLPGGVTIDDDGNIFTPSTIGIAETTPLSELSIKRGNPDNASNANSLLSSTGRTTGTDILRGGHFVAERWATSPTSNILIGMNSQARDFGSVDLTNTFWAIVGVRGRAGKDGGSGGTIGAMRAFTSLVEVKIGVNGVTITNACAYVAEPVEINGASTADHACSFWGKAHTVINGTINHAWGVRLAKQTVGGTNHALVLEGDGIGSDVVFGVDQDAMIYYDGTDLIIDPNVVGSGAVLIGITGDDKLRAQEIASIAGDFKIMPGAVGDVILFGDTDVDDADGGKMFYVYRKAVEGDNFIRFYITADQVATIHSNTNLIMQVASSKYIRITSKSNLYLDLGDNAGSDKLKVRDSDSAEVFAVDSNGNLTIIGTVDGRDVDSDGAKLDTIESNATADQTDAEIRDAVEAASDSNTFTDADHTKLDGLGAGGSAWELQFPALARQDGDTGPNRQGLSGSKLWVRDFGEGDKDVWWATLPISYDGGGLTYTILVMAAATSGDAVFGIRMDRIGVVNNIEDDGYSGQNVSSATAVSGTSRVPFEVEITFSDGVDMASLAAGELFRFELESMAAGTVSGALEVITTRLRES